MDWNTQPFFHKSTLLSTMKQAVLIKIYPLIYLAEDIICVKVVFAQNVSSGITGSGAFSGINDRSHRLLTG